HGARAARGRPRTRLRRPWPARPGRRPDLDLAQSAQPDAGAQLGGQLPERARPPPLPVQAAHRRLPPLPPPDEPPCSHGFVDPPRVDELEYLGEVTHGEKVELLQTARATLFPIEWEEPFGLVLV